MGTFILAQRTVVGNLSLQPFAVLQREAATSEGKYA
jgi:hypothetical protein